MWFGSDRLTLGTAAQATLPTPPPLSNRMFCAYIGREAKRWISHPSARPAGNFGDAVAACMRKRYPTVGDAHWLLSHFPPNGRNFPWTNSSSSSLRVPFGSSPMMAIQSGETSSPARAGSCCRTCCTVEEREEENGKDGKARAKKVRRAPCRMPMGKRRSDGHRHIYPLAGPDGSATARQDGVGGAEELPDTAET
jgi:hypothetical protein